MENLANIYLIERNNREIEHIKKTTKDKDQIDKLLESNKNLNNLINNKENKKENTNNSHLDSIFDKISKNIENQEWKNLPHFIKKEKINDFINNKIDSSHKKNVKKLIQSSKKIKLSDYNYNQETCCLENIKCLKFENNKYII